MFMVLLGANDIEKIIEVTGLQSAEVLFDVLFVFRTHELLDLLFTHWPRHNVARISSNLGEGKKWGTRAFGRIISKNPEKRFDFEMHSF